MTNSKQVIYNTTFINNAISSLNNEIKCKAILLCDNDGNLIAFTDNGISVEMETVAALTAAAMGMGKRICNSLNFEYGEGLILQGLKGMLIVRNISAVVYVGVVVPVDANLAMVNLMTKQMIKQLKDGGIV